jgi:Uma2 family endonuclease
LATLIQDARLARELIAERRRLGHDRRDEVWDGTYIIYAPVDIEHQEIQVNFLHVLGGLIESSVLRGKLYPGVNVSDRKRLWKKNYRCPDITFFLKDTKSVNCGDFHFGGPDFAVEIVSPDDRTREKLDFYAKVGTRELLIVDRKPWALELYRLDGDALARVGKSTLAKRDWLASEVVPLKFRLVAGKSRPEIVAAHATTRKTWRI